MHMPSNILNRLSTGLFGTKQESAPAPAPVSNDKVLSFTDAYVTECVENNRPVFEWDGTKGMISDYLIRDMAGEWRLKISARRNNPFIGQLIAVPTGRRTASIYKRAKIREMVSLGIDKGFAALYVSRSRNVRYNMEPAVMCWVYQHFMMPQSDLDILCNSMVPKAAAAELGYRSDDISQSRFSYCLTIVRNIRQGDPVIQFAIANRSLRLPLDVIEEPAADLAHLVHTRGIRTDLTNEEIRRALRMVATHPNLH